VQGGPIAEDVRPGLPLAELLGRVFTGLARAVPVRVDVEVRGEIAEHDVRILQLAALKGAFTDVVEDVVTYVNAPLLAADRGVDVRLVTSTDSPDYRNVVTVRGTLADGTTTSVSGTVSGPRHTAKLVDVDGYDLDIVPTEHMTFLRYVDRPGVIGVIGRILGERGINIASMQVGRDAKGGHALGVLAVDSALPGSVLDEIVAGIGAASGRTVDLVDVDR
jgi:D-3-phosphoglycerate dehydrogenase